MANITSQIDQTHGVTNNSISNPKYKSSDNYLYPSYVGTKKIMGEKHKHVNTK